MKNILIVVWMILPFFSADKEKTIFKETFDYPDGTLPSMWWSEGCPAQIRDGRLFVDADTVSFRAATVWLDKSLSGNVRIEFDVHIVSSSDKADNINCFFMYSDPGGSDLRSTSPSRACGTYTLYHQMNGYIFTNVANGKEANVRFRLRDNPGFHLIRENYSGQIEIGKTYHVKIEKKDDRLQYWTNGKRIINTVDKSFNPIYENGLFGFRTWHTSLWWDNLVITQLD